MSIIADGEEVIFEGEIPNEPSRIYELLMNAYSEQSKVVVKFFVDGVDALQAGSFPESFEKIEAESVTHHELTLRLSIESINQMSGFDKDFENYLRNVLSAPWSQVFKKMDELVSKMQPFADLLDNLGPYSQVYAPTWKEDYDELVKEQHAALTGILNAFEQAKQFTAATEVNALAQTKLDGTAKGGVVIGISDQFKIPVKYIGVGEQIDDLQLFDRKAFVESLFQEGKN